LRSGRRSINLISGSSEQTGTNEQREITSTR
jgi:hypothetical protein